MTDDEQPSMRSLRFHEYGEPGDVLRLDDVPVPEPGSGRIRVVTHAAGLAPADWALCRGLFAGGLPRGVGIDVSGVVDAVGDEVGDVRVGDRVFGSADWRGATTAGASDRAIMDRWTIAPEGLDLTAAAALPLALQTAYGSLALLGLTGGRTILINGAGSTIGTAAVQIALARGLRVLATAGTTHADRLRELGAAVTSYGDGMVGRVRALADGPIDIVLDTAPAGGVLPDLVDLAGGEPSHVLTVSDFAAAAELGVRTNLGASGIDPFEAFPEFAQRAAEGRFAVPVAATVPLDEWRRALELSLGGRAGGKVLLVP